MIETTSGHKYMSVHVTQESCRPSQYACCCCYYKMAGNPAARRGSIAYEKTITIEVLDITLVSVVPALLVIYSDG